MTYTQVWDAMQDKVNELMIQRDADNAFIPFDDANTDYIEYKAWLDEGNEPASLFHGCISLLRRTANLTLPFLPTGTGGRRASNVAPGPFGS